MLRPGDAGATDQHDLRTAPGDAEAVVVDEQQRSIAEQRDPLGLPAISRTSALSNLSFFGNGLMLRVRSGDRVRAGETVLVV